MFEEGTYPGGDSTWAHARLQGDPTTGQASECDVVVWEKTWAGKTRWAVDSDASVFQVDLRFVLVHELGHCTGLDHYEGSNPWYKRLLNLYPSVMTPFIWPGQDYDGLRYIDEAAITFLYGSFSGVYRSMFQGDVWVPGVGTESAGASPSGPGEPVDRVGRRSRP